MGFPNSATGITKAEREKLAKIDVGVKSNLNATAAPTVTDDTTKGYSAGSTWRYNNITYICGDATEGKAEWADSSEISYFDTWPQLVAAISVAGTSYVNKYASVANANGGPVGGTTYTAPNALINYIVDGGTAAYKILAQGDKYSVTCTPRTVTNPVISKVMLFPAPKPTLPGYYIFTVNPTDGLPAGVGLNDIAYYDGSVWSLFQLYIKATAVLVATDQTMTTQVTWRKFAGTWMSTADEFNTDKIEYQTGKLWNGKPVYRIGFSGSTNVDPLITLPVGFKLVSLWMTIQRSDLVWVQVMASGGEVMISIGADRKISLWAGNSLYVSRPYYAWVEYTKS
jgi:hypothetical protein